MGPISPAPAPLPASIDKETAKVLGMHPVNRFFLGNQDDDQISQKEKKRELLKRQIDLLVKAE